MPDAKISTKNVDDRERSEIDREIIKFELAIRQLKCRRNNLAPISRLPPEVLGKVFSFIENEEWESVSSRPSWIGFSQVSHSWRTVAINTPELWGELPLWNLKQAKLMLERSKMADLSIDHELSHIPTSISPVVTFLQDVLANHLSRISRLRLTYLKPATFSQLFKDCPSSRASRLHTLHFSAFPGFAFVSSPLDPQSTLPDELFLETERLRHLELSACNINWDAPLLRNLESLTVRLNYNRPSLIQFLTALRAMPGLKSLKMSHSLPNSNDTLVSSKDTVNLARLHELHLAGTLNEVASVMVHISIPSAAALNLDVEDVKEKGRQLSALLSSIAAMEKGSTQPYRSLTWNIGNLNSLSCNIWRDEAPKDMSHSPGFPSLVIRICDHGLESWDAVTHQLLSSLPLQKLESLTYSSKDVSHGILSQTLGTLPSLSRIRVSGDGTLTLIKAMFKTTPQDDMTVPFPVLRKIWIQGAMFDENHPQDNRNALEMLQDCLMERCEYGAAIEAIHIDQCYSFDASSEETLQGIVVDVEWDEEQLEQEWEDTDEDEDDDEDDFNYEDDDDYLEDSDELNFSSYQGFF